MVLNKTTNMLRTIGLELGQGKYLVRKLITSNVGSSPDTSFGAYGPRDVSGEEPPLSKINSYIIYVVI